MQPRELTTHPRKILPHLRIITPHPREKLPHLREIPPHLRKITTKEMGMAIIVKEIPLSAILRSTLRMTKHKQLQQLQMEHKQEQNKHRKKH
jgi:hypothetical protein